MSTILVNLKVHDLVPHDSNVRHDLGDLAELIASICEQGILQPLIVAPREGVIGQHVIIAGHRRHAAAVKAGLAEVPCIVRNDLTHVSDQIEAMLVENLQRTDLTVMEEAAAYEQLELLGATLGDIVRATGRSQRTVKARRDLMRLPETAREWVGMGQISLDTAEYLVQYADDPEMVAAIEEAWPTNVRYAVQRVLWQREQAEEVARQAEVDPVQKRAEAVAAAQVREAEYEERRAAAESRRAVIEVSRATVSEWFTGVLADNPKGLVEKLLRLGLTRAIGDDADFAALRILGLKAYDEAEDFDDYAAQVRAKVLAAPAAKLMLAAAVDYSRMFELGSYGFEYQLADIVDVLGYEPSEAERALLDTL